MPTTEAKADIEAQLVEVETRLQARLISFYVLEFSLSLT